MVIACSGHRLGPKVGGWSFGLRKRLESTAIDILKTDRPDYVISGMALGWDMAVVAACVALNIPFVAAVPCKDQARPWPKEYQEDWEHYIYLATHVEWVHDGGYDATVMQKRNEWMVNQLDPADDFILALWNGEKSGGTWNCIRYAESKNVKVSNVWDKFKKV